MEEGLQDLSPLVKLNERENLRFFRKINLMILLILMLIYIALIVIVVNNLGKDISYFNCFIIFSIVFSLVSFGSGFLMKRKRNIINEKIKEYFSRINAEKYLRLGLNWELHCGNWISEQDKIVLKKIGNQNQV